MQPLLEHITKVRHHLHAIFVQNLWRFHVQHGDYLYGYNVSLKLALDWFAARSRIAPVTNGKKLIFQREKPLENIFALGKSGSFVIAQGNLEMT